MSAKNSNTHRYSFSVSLLHPRYWLTWLGLGVFFLVTLLPARIVDSLGCRLGRIAASKNKKRFNIVKTNLTLCFPDKSEAEVERLVAEHFQVQYRSLLHYAYLWWRPFASVRKKIRTSGFEQIEHYQAQGKTIIVLLTHNVGLDFAGAAIAMDYASNAPYKKVRNDVVDWKIANGRLRFGKKFGSKLFTRDDGLKPLVRETRAGNILIYLADEDLGAKDSIFVPFYGVPKATIPLLGRLTKLCDAVVLPCVACYDSEQRQYHVQLLPRIEGLPSGDDMTDSLNMNKAIESAINQCPVQYLWTLRYFQTRPNGEASVYE